MNELNLEALWRRAQYEAKRKVELLYPLRYSERVERERKIAIKLFKQMAYRDER